MFLFCSFPSMLAGSYHDLARIIEKLDCGGSNLERLACSVWEINYHHRESEWKVGYGSNNGSGST